MECPLEFDKQDHFSYHWLNEHGDMEGPLPMAKLEVCFRDIPQVLVCD
jgi:hypothetical protein